MRHAGWPHREQPSHPYQCVGIAGYDARTSPTDFPSTFTLLFHPDDQGRVRREFEELSASDCEEYETEYRVRTKDGSTRWHLVAARCCVTRRENQFVSSVPQRTSPTSNKQNERCGRARSGSDSSRKTSAGCSGRRKAVGDPLPRADILRSMKRFGRHHESPASRNCSHRIQGITYRGRFGLQHQLV